MISLDSKKLLDGTGREILRQLQTEGRISFAELGRRVGLSLPAVAERVRRMEAAGLITGYRAEVDPARLGLPVMAFVRISTPEARYSRLIELARDLPEVLECHHLTGADAFMLKVVAASIPRLEAVLVRLGAYGQTTTSIVLSSPVIGRVLEPEPPESHNQIH